MDTPSTQAGPGIVASGLLDDLLPFLTESICLYDHQGNLKARLSPPDGILGRGETIGANVFDNLHPDDLPLAIQLSDRVVDGEPGGSLSVRLRLGDRHGAYRAYQIRAFNRLGDPRLDGIVVCIGEIEPRSTGPELPVDAAPASMADALPTPYLTIGNRGNVRYTNRAAAELLRTPGDRIYGRPLVDLVVAEDRASLRAAVDDVTARPGHRTAVARTLPAHGDRLLEINLHATGTDGRSTLVAVALVDRTHEPELIRAATHDPLTGLANRTKLANTITGLLLEVGSDLTVAYVDLDHFKALNDTHGHATGDRALVAVAEGLRARTRPGDLVARMSGDEFVVVCPRLSAEAGDRLLERIGRPIDLPGDHQLRVLLSAGLATAHPGDTAETLVERADAAMYEAKRRRRGDHTES